MEIFDATEKKSLYHTIRTSTSAPADFSIALTAVHKHGFCDAYINVCLDPMMHS